MAEDKEEVGESVCGVARQGEKRKVAALVVQEIREGKYNSIILILNFDTVYLVLVHVLCVPGTTGTWYTTGNT